MASVNSPESTSAASWGAIIAGALVAISISLILLALGSGLGFASMSPWTDRGASAGALTIAAVIWLIVTQWVSSIFGGYITGRLRTRWVGTHVHEVFFRDTANGLVTWALATVIVAALVGSSATAGLSVGVKAASGAASAGIQGAAQGASATAATGSSSYGVDKLFRSDAVPGPNGATSGTTGATSGATGATGSDQRAEAGRILVNDLAAGEIPDADRSYLANLVAGSTGVPVADAQKRVDDLIAAADAARAKVKEDADVARKNAAEASIYLALSLLIGAFIASVSAALGGRLRDEHI